MPHFMIVLIPYINLLNLSWIIKCLFFRNVEPLIWLIFLLKKMNFGFLYILMFLLSPEDVESALIRMTKLVLTGPLDEIDLREDARYVVCDT